MLRTWTGATLVLDLNNLYVNSQNAGFDPVEWMSEVAISETSLIHLAGGSKNDLGFLVDGHNEAVFIRIIKRFAEFDRALIREGILWGLDHARAGEKKLGCLRGEDHSGEIRGLKRARLSHRQVIQKLGVSKEAIVRALD